MRWICRVSSVFGVHRQGRWKCRSDHQAGTKSLYGALTGVGSRGAFMFSANPYCARALGRGFSEMALHDVPPVANECVIAHHSFVDQLRANTSELYSNERFAYASHHFGRYMRPRRTDFSRNLSAHTLRADETARGQQPNCMRGMAAMKLASRTEGMTHAQYETRADDSELK